MSEAMNDTLVRIERCVKQIYYLLFALGLLAVGYVLHVWK